MKPAPFRYAAPDSLDEALALLGTHGPEAKVLAGGQSLVPMMNLRLARPAVIVDVNRIAGHDAVRESAGGTAIGFLARQRTFETTAEAARRVPLLAEAVAQVGHPAIRSRGTIAGSAAHADPAAEIPAVLLALDATIVLRSAAGERRLDAGDFFVDFFTTALRPEEIVVEVVVPARGPEGTAFVEVARRHGDFALAGAAAVVAGPTGGPIERARVVLSGVAGTPVRAREAEALLLGARPSPALFAEAGRVAAAPLDPPADIHATSAYRRRLASVLTERAIARAAQRAGLEGNR